MSHNPFQRELFARSREWRKLRAMIAADERHGNHERAQKNRELLLAARELGALRALAYYFPGFFELGKGYDDNFYKLIDAWGPIMAPGAFRKASS